MVYPLEYLDEHGYPTDECLEAIRTWEIESGLSALLDVLREAWTYGDDAMILKESYTDRLSKKRYRTFELHTIGWSGNEDIMSALAGNLYFFALYWRKTEVGGHYYFRLPADLKW